MGRINVTSAQAANYINILSLEDAVKLYWNLQAISGEFGFCQIDDDCNPRETCASSFAAVSATLQPDERIASVSQLTDFNSTSGSIPELFTSGLLRINGAVREVYNTTTNEVLGYSLPHNIFGSLLQCGARILQSEDVDHGLNFFATIATVDSVTTFPEYDFIFEARTRFFAKRDIVDVTLLGVDLKAIIYRDAEIRVAFYDDLILDAAPCADIEYAMTVTQGSKSYTVGFADLAFNSGLQDILDSAERWTYG